MSEWCDECDAVIDPMPEGAAWFHVPDPSSVKFAPAGEPLDSDRWTSVGWIDADALGGAGYVDWEATE